MTPELARPRPLTVGDVMTAAVVTVAESATFHEMAALMRAHALSGLPVLGARGELVGIVSEADLLHKETPPSDQSRLWPESRERRSARAKSMAASAAEAMTRPVITVAPRATLAAAARLMLEHHVKRLPVVDDDGRLIGIVSRRDMLTAFVRSDAEIRRDILEGVLPGWLGVAPDAVAVSVHGGVVTIRGTVDRRSDVEVVEHVVASLDGVVRVDADLGYGFDDRNIKPAREGRV
jgi:CBS domain-containing protein